MTTKRSKGVNKPLNTIAYKGTFENNQDNVIHALSPIVLYLANLIFPKLHRLYFNNMETSLTHLGVSFSSIFQGLNAPCFV